VARGFEAWGTIKGVTWGVIQEKKKGTKGTKEKAPLGGRAYFIKLLLESKKNSPGEKREFQKNGGLKYAKDTESQETNTWRKNGHNSRRNSESSGQLFMS